MKKYLITGLSLSLLSLVSIITQANDSHPTDVSLYDIGITISTTNNSDDGLVKTEKVISQNVLLKTVSNKSVEFSSGIESPYISSSTTTTSWYHRLFNIKPKPKYDVDVQNHGLYISALVTEEGDWVKLNFTMDEIVLNSFRSVISNGNSIQLPNISTSKFKQTLSYNNLAGKSCKDVITVNNKSIEKTVTVCLTRTRKA